MKFLGRLTLLLCASFALLLTGIANCQTVDGTHHIAFPFGTSAGQTSELRSYELTANGENYFAWKAADLMVADNPYVMPAAYPASSNLFLSCTTAGVCTWSSSSTGLPVVDTTSIVKGSADATKEMRFEVDDLLATGKISVLTVQDADYILAGTDITNLFSVSQRWLNDTKIFFEDTVGTPITTLWLDGSNFLHIGTVDAITGNGDVIFYSDGAAIAKLINAQDSVGVPEKVFAPGIDRVNNIGGRDALWEEIHGEDLYLGRGTSTTEVQGALHMYAGTPAFSLATTIQADTLGSIATLSIEWFGGPLVPGSHNSMDIGFDDGVVDRRPRKIYTVDLDVSGVCAGCGAGLWTDNTTNISPLGGVTTAVAIGTVTPLAKFTVVGDLVGEITSLVQAPGSATADVFVVENSGGSDLFTVEANGEVGIGTANPTQLLDIDYTDGTLELRTATFQLVLANDAAANTQPALHFEKSRSGGPALDNDFIGVLDWSFLNSASAVKQGALIRPQLLDNTVGTEDGRLAFFTIVNGSVVQRLAVDANVLVSAELRPSSDGAFDNGNNVLRWKRGWFDLVNSEKYELENTAHTAHFTFKFENVNTELQFLDTAGAEVLTLQTSLNLIQFHDTLVPFGASIDVGTTGLPFATVFANNIGSASFASNGWFGTADVITLDFSTSIIGAGKVGMDWHPDGDGTRNLGGVAESWDNVNAQNYRLETAADVSRIELNNTIASFTQFRMNNDSGVRRIDIGINANDAAVSLLASSASRNVSLTTISGFEGLTIGGNRVVGPQCSALPTDATDLATVIALTNATKDCVNANNHGLAAGT